MNGSNEGIVDILKRYRDGSYKDNYNAYVKELRVAYGEVLGRSKTLLDAIINSERIQHKFDISNKLLVNDIADVLLTGKQHSFAKYMLVEPIGERTHTLSIVKPKDYKNYTNSKFEFNYLVNVIGLEEVVNMLGALVKTNI